MQWPDIRAPPWRARPLTWRAGAQSRRAQRSSRLDKGNQCTFQRHLDHLKSYSIRLSMVRTGYAGTMRGQNHSMPR